MTRILMIHTTRKTMIALGLLGASFITSASVPPPAGHANTYMQMYVHHDNKAFVDTAFKILLQAESLTKQFTTNKETGEKIPLISPAGAIGVAQVQPTTAKWIVEDILKEGLWTDDLLHKLKYDAEYNTRLGKAYFKYLLERFDNRLEHAYAAYNWGPTILRTTLNEHGNNWFNKIPDETKKYVSANTSAFVEQASTTNKKTPRKLAANLL